ncbi:MAG: DUF5317 family protein [Mycobacteriales bacterium]
MALVVVCAVIALAAALLAGGNITAVESVPWQDGILLGAALFCQVAGVVLGHAGLPAGPTYAVACLVGAVLLGVVARRHGSVAGTELLAIGLFLNFAVIALNTNMPVSAYALARAGAPAQGATDIRHEPATGETTLGLLAEVIPVPLPGHPEADSLGDLLVAAGLGQLIFVAVRRRRKVSEATEPAKPEVLTQH